MKIILYEMRKIWSIKMVAIVALLCAMFYIIFMEFYITYFPNGHPSTEEVSYSIELVQQYGPKIEKKEYDEFIEETKKELLSEAETYIKTIPIFAQAGIYTFKDYEEVCEKEEELTALESDARWTLLGEECDFLGFKIQTISGMASKYDNYLAYTLDRGLPKDISAKGLARVNEILEAEEYGSIMNGEVYYNTLIYFFYLAILVLVAVVVIISPLIVMDRARNIHYLQYSSKLGRRILYQQFGAVMFSAFLIITALVFAFGAIYSKNGTFIFWNNGMTSFLNYTFLWFRLTYGQYLIFLVVMLYMMGLGSAAFGFVLSRLSQNIITLILKLIMTLFILGVVCFCVFSFTFSPNNILYMKTGVIGIEFWISCIVLLAGLAVSVGIVLREKKLDIV